MSRYFLTQIAIEGFRGINNNGDPLTLSFGRDLAGRWRPGGYKNLCSLIGPLRAFIARAPPGLYFLEAALPEMPNRHFGRSCLDELSHRPVLNSKFGCQRLVRWVTAGNEIVNPCDEMGGSCRPSIVNERSFYFVWQAQSYQGAFHRKPAD
ncbi:hypothetical protein QCD71_22140 [Sphingomonas sp. PsM26]|jgi:hypothetical protein|nr:hypothetical protein [Sphingomonas sp. PsM26]